MRKSVAQIQKDHPEEYDRFRFHRLPGHMQHGFIDYIFNGTPMGHFGRAVLSNQLVEAFNRADADNTARMRDTAAWLYNYCPTEARGSEEKVAAWEWGGGLFGLWEQAAKEAANVDSTE